jgi:hypothetical protein
VKKLFFVFIFAISAGFALDNTIFTGIWCVEKDDMRIEFIGKDSVKFSASGDESVNGNGRFSFDDTLLTAELENAGMKMKIVYRYSKTEKGVKVITKSLAINGDELNANPDPIFLTRCKK